MTTITTPLEAIQNGFETVNIKVEHNTTSTICQDIDIESGGYFFNFDIEIDHEYRPGDRDTGEEYEFVITNMDKTLNSIHFDGEEVKFGKVEGRKIEKAFEEYGQFNLFKY